MSRLNIESLNNDKKIHLALIHGWGIGRAAWTPLLEAITQHFNVHLVELLGYCISASIVNKQSSDTPPSKPHEQTILGDIACRAPFNGTSSTSSFTATAAALADALPEGCIVCGWSLGSMLSLQAALLRPGHFSRLILVGSTPSFMQRDNWPHAQAPALLETFTSAIAKNAGVTLQRFIALLNQGDSQARAITRTLTNCLAQSNISDTATLVQGLCWLRDVDLRSQIASINVPTLLIHGHNDPLMPLAAAQWLQEKLPQAQLEVFSAAAHAPFLHDQQHFVQLIVDYCHAFATDSAIN